jgi:serine protease AprX
MTTEVSASAENVVRAFLPKSLLDAVVRAPDSVFQVIVQGRGMATAADVAASVEALPDDAGADGVDGALVSIGGVAAELTGEQILRLATRRSVLAITPDAPVQLVGGVDNSGLSNVQKWPYAAGAYRIWHDVETTGLAMPTIAVVDSGIENRHDDFGGRVLAEVNLTSLPGNSPGDGRGHGTLVAGIAAGSAPGYTGMAPSANIVSLDVMDDNGMARTSDVIAAADWILRHRNEYGIRVANFSLHSSVPASITFDPLNRAVERLWFGGVVVVAAAGNYGTDGSAVGVTYAPGNDPFVITVGAADIGRSTWAYDDFNAPWSAWGYTLDGFMKPDVGAPGRYIVGPAPPDGKMAQEKPEKVRADGYIESSGTSFAAPVVSGIAAYLLALNPGWTPDQVKGAIMLSAKPAGLARPGSLGVGMVKASYAARIVRPPNPNLALRPFVVEAPGGGAVPVFDAASWASTALADASWASASWASASWASASWASASWASASWASASWASASWASASWASASWASASWNSSSFADNAEGETGASEDDEATADDLAASAEEAGVDPPADAPVPEEAGEITSNGDDAAGEGVASESSTPAIAEPEPADVAPADPAPAAPDGRSSEADEPVTP